MTWGEALADIVRSGLEGLGDASLLGLSVLGWICAIALSWAVLATLVAIPALVAIHCTGMVAP